MRKWLTLGAIGLAACAGSAQAHGGIHFGSGLSFGICGTGFSISSGIHIGGWGHNHHHYRPRVGWYDSGCDWGYPRHYGYTSRSYRQWDSGYYAPVRPRHARRYRSDCWSDAELSAPYPSDVIATHDLPPNRTPAPSQEVKDEVPTDERIAKAWELLESGRLNQAQGYFAFAAAKSPENAEAKLGYALVSMRLGESERATWSAGRALELDEGALASLEFGTEAQMAFADLLTALEVEDDALAARLGEAVPGVFDEVNLAQGG